MSASKSNPTPNSFIAEIGIDPASIQANCLNAIRRVLSCPDLLPDPCHTPRLSKPALARSSSWPSLGGTDPRVPAAETGMVTAPGGWLSRDTTTEENDLSRAPLEAHPTEHDALDCEMSQAVGGENDVSCEERAGPQQTDQLQDGGSTLIDFSTNSPSSLSVCPSVTLDQPGRESREAIFPPFCSQSWPVIPPPARKVRIWDITRHVGPVGKHSLSSGDVSSSLCDELSPKQMCWRHLLEELGSPARKKIRPLTPLVLVADSGGRACSLQCFREYQAKDGEFLISGELSCVVPGPKAVISDSRFRKYPMTIRHCSEPGPLSEVGAYGDPSGEYEGFVEVNKPQIMVLNSPAGARNMPEIESLSVNSPPVVDVLMFSIHPEGQRATVRDLVNLTQSVGNLEQAVRRDIRHIVRSVNKCADDYRSLCQRMEALEYSSEGTSGSSRGGPASEEAVTGGNGTSSGSGSSSTDPSTRTTPVRAPSPAPVPAPVPDPAIAHEPDPAPDQLPDVIGEIRVLETRDTSINQVEHYTGDEIGTFTPWITHFLHYLEANEITDERKKISRLRFFFRGRAGRELASLSAEDSQTLDAIIEALRPRFENPLAMELARRKLATCLQRPNEPVEAFARRLIPLVDAVTADLEDEPRRKRLFQEFLDRVLPSIKFFTRLAAPSLTSFEELRVKAVEVETMLEENPQFALLSERTLSRQAESPDAIRALTAEMRRMTGSDWVVEQIHPPPRFPRSNNRDRNRPPRQRGWAPNGDWHRQVRFQTPPRASQRWGNNSRGGFSGNRGRFRQPFNRNRPPPGDGQNWSGRPSCHYCGRLGHYAYNCYDRRAGAPPVTGPRPLALPPAQPTQSFNSPNPHINVMQMVEGNQVNEASRDDGVPDTVVIHDEPIPPLEEEPDNPPPAPASALSLTRFLLSLLMVLLLFAPSTSALKRPTSPLYCPADAQPIVWELKSEVDCPRLAVTREEGRPLTLQVYQRRTRTAEHKAYACKKVVHRTRYYTNVIGDHIKEKLPRTASPLSVKDCLEIKYAHVCEGSRMNYSGAIWESHNPLRFDFPLPVLGSFQWKHSQATNCFGYHATIGIHGKNRLIQSQIAKAEECHLDEGTCQLSDGTRLVWDLPEDMNFCQFVRLGTFRGRRAGNSWVSNDNQMALTWSGESREETACNRTYRRTDQGLWIALRELEGDEGGRVRARRESSTGPPSHNNSTPYVSPQQLAAQLTALDKNLTGVIRYAVNYLTVRLCSQSQWLLHTVFSSSSHNPTLLVRALLNENKLRAKMLSQGLFKVFPCVELSPRDYKFLGTGNSGKCFEFAPIVVNVKGERMDVFLDPSTNVIVKHSQRVPCRTGRIIHLHLNGSFVALDQVTGVTSEIPPHEVWEVGLEDRKLDELIGELVFTKLVLTRWTEPEIPTHITEAIHAEQATFSVDQVTSADTLSDSADFWKGQIQELRDYYPFKGLLEKLWSLWVTMVCVYASVQLVNSLASLAIRTGLGPYMAAVRPFLNSFTPQYPSWPARRRHTSRMAQDGAEEAASVHLHDEVNERVQVLRDEGDELLPIIEMPVNGVKTKVLIDTGSSHCWASPQALCFTRLGIDSKLDLRPVRIPSFDAAGNPLKDCHWADVLFEFRFPTQGPCMGLHPVHFSESLHFPLQQFELIMGCDLLDMLGGVRIDYLEEKVYLTGHEYAMIDGPDARRGMQVRMIRSPARPAEAPIALSPNRFAILSDENPIPPPPQLTEIIAAPDARIEANFNGKPVRCLIDTGASISVAAIELATLTDTRLYKTPANRSVAGLSGSSMRLNAVGDLTVSIGRRDVRARMYFTTKQLCEVKGDYDAILGCDVLRKISPFTMDLAQGTMTILTLPKDTGFDPPCKLQVRVPLPMVVPPSTQTIISCKIDEVPPGFEEVMNQQLYSCTGTESLNPALSQVGLTVAPSVATPANGTYPLLVSNPTSAPITLYFNQSLVKIYRVEPEEQLVTRPDEIRAIKLASNPEDWKVDPTFVINYDGCEVSAEELLELKALNEEFNDVFSKGQYDLGDCKVAPIHLSTTTENPVASKPHRIPFQFQGHLQKHIDNLLRAKRVKPSNTPWVSNIVLVMKKDGEMRPCIDFRKLNEVTVPDYFPIPRIEAVLERIGHCGYYSALDAAKGFQQLRLDEESSYKAGILTENQVLAATHLPFGMRNATAWYARAMAEVLSGLADNVIAYIDDILVFTKSHLFAEHLAVLRSVYERFREYDLKLHPKKCEFATKTVKFLGHVIGADGYQPSARNLQPIVAFPAPNTVRQVRRFCGMASFYRRFIPGFSDLVEPLTRLVRKEHKFVWGSEQEEAFEEVKRRLTSEPILTFPDYSKPFHIFTDASAVAQAGALLQKSAGEEGKPPNAFSAVSYCSRILSSSERRWPTVQAELGAIIFALRSFKPYLYGSKVIVHTDHKALSFLQKKAQTHAHLARWLIELQTYDIEVRYVSGRQNALADALSRVHEDLPDEAVADVPELQDIAEFPVCLRIGKPRDNPRLAAFKKHEIVVRDADGHPSAVDLAKSQRADPSLIPIFKYLEEEEVSADLTGEKRDEFEVKCDNFRVGPGGILYYSERFVDGIPIDSARIVIPQDLRSLIFDFFHSSPLGGGHMAFGKTLKKCFRYYWPGMYRDLSQWCRACVNCQLRRPVPPNSRNPMCVVPRHTLFSKVGIDLCGPIVPVTEMGNRYIMNMICWHSRYVVSVAVPDSRASTLARALLVHCYLIFGGCDEIVTDHASSFSSDLFNEVCKLFYVGKVYSTPYWSQGNGETERSFRTFQDMLSKYLDKNSRDYDLFLPFVAFCYNTSVSDSTGESPFFLVFGRDPVFCVERVLAPKTPIAYGTDDLADFKRALVRSLRTAWVAAAAQSQAAQQRMKLQYDKKALVQRDFSVGDRVLMKNYENQQGRSKKFRMLWEGQYRVVDIDLPHVVLENCLKPRAATKRVHVDQIKHCVELTGPACTLGTDQDSDDGEQPNDPEPAPTHKYNLRSRPTG